MESSKNHTFKRITLLGSSNQSQIYKVLNTESDKFFALKVINHNPNKHLDQCDHLYQEYNILSQISHKNIIEVYQLKITQDKGKKHKDNLPSRNKENCMILMELCDIDLFKLIQSNFPTMLEISFIQRVMFQVANALRCLHDKAQICHFDLKPENIFLQKQSPKLVVQSMRLNTKSDELVKSRSSFLKVKESHDDFDSYQVKLGDFGFASFIKDMNQKQCQQIWYNRSYSYISPEIQELAQKIDNNQPFQINNINWPAVDVFAYGVTLFSVIFLISPFEDEKASVNDSRYKYIVQKRFDRFWGCNPQVKLILQGINDRENLKDLIQKTIAFNPEERISMKDVQNHPWLNKK